MTTLPTRHFAFIISGIEYESGWGCRPDGVVAFLDEKIAEDWIKDYDKKFNNEKVVPHEYTKYSKDGFHSVSEATMKELVEKGKVFAHHLVLLQ
jgi:hypothetical protein